MASPSSEVSNGTRAAAADQKEGALLSLLPKGWKLAASLALAVVLMSGAILLLAGTGEQGVRVLIRATARSSALFFLMAYLARPLHQLRRSPLSAWLLRQRRYLGVSVACSHAVHLAAIVTLVNNWPGEHPVDALTRVLGGLGFVFLGVMAATSSDAAVAFLGRNRWRALHRAGIHYLWFIFAFTFVPEIGWDALHALALAAFLGAAGIRLAAWLRNKNDA